MLIILHRSYMDDTGIYAGDTFMDCTISNAMKSFFEKRRGGEKDIQTGKFDKKQNTDSDGKRVGGVGHDEWISYRQSYRNDQTV